jgi:DNA-binding PadR family transcriptional regulator
VRPLLRALQMEGYLESVLRDGIGRVYQLTEQGREELATSRSRIDELYRRLHHSGATASSAAPHTAIHNS